MRKEMKEAFLKEEKKQVLSERKEHADRLFEKWSKEQGIGESMDKIMDKNPEKARNLSIVLENQKNHLQSLTETQISNDFSTTPQNVLRIVRLGYPNSVRGEIFFDYPMVTARDSIFYLSPVYGATARGATAANITHESSAYRYASEIQEQTIDTTEGTESTFVTTLSGYPVRPYSVIVLLNEKPIASDNGSGTITGDLLDSASTNSITYSDGSVTLNFTANPDAGQVLKIMYHTDTEDADDGRDYIKSVELQLTDYQFRCRPYPLYVSWSKMAELLLGTTLDIDAEESLIAGAADELKKSLDFLAVKMGHRYSRQNDAVTFNADWATGGSDSEKAHAQSLSKTAKQAANVIYGELQRGGISAWVVGSDAAAFLTLHDQFSADNVQPEIGIYRVGSWMGKPVYQAPSDVVPTNEMLGVWRNPNADGGDYSLVFGTLIPLYQTQVLEYKEGYSETGLFHFGDWKAIQPKYLVRVQLLNL
jgi:hypothetical protein